MKKFIAALMVMGALIAPSYAVEVKCYPFKEVFEALGQPEPITMTRDGDWIAFWKDMKNDVVLGMRFTPSECWTGDAELYTIEGFINLGPINGRLYTSYEG